jgi:hypothetical protein
MRKSYRTVFELNLQATTSARLREAIGELGVSGDTARKATAFFVEAATYCGIALSPFITTRNPKKGRAKRKQGTREVIVENLRQTSLDQSPLQARTHSVALGRLGRAELRVQFDIIELTEEDFAFISRLFDTMLEYERKQLDDQR